MSNELQPDEMVYKIVVSPAVNDRMAEHFEFLARVSEDAANNLLDGLTNDMMSLQKLPFRNPVYDRPYIPLLKYRYMVSNKRYRIVYQIVDNIVYIDDIQDMRQSDGRSMLH